MSVLSQKLQQASKQFQTHNFKKSLDAYEDCLSFCYKTDEVQSVVFNILSTKATLQYILGDYDDALSTLNSVLKKDSNHFLSLLRRSQVYKKKNKLKKALKDLETIYVFCPDNLQISAFKAEIEHLLLKQQKQHQITSESDDDEEEEENQLNFIKLKLIDRKSSDGSAIKQRKSRVTILGDTTFEYKIDEDAQNSQDEENVYDKALRTYKQIELDDEEDSDLPIISIKAPRRGKSILKNKGCSIFIQPEDIETRKSRYLGRESKLVTLVKNIDGKVIPSAEHEHLEHPLVKEVQFRKSISQVNGFLNVNNDNHSVASSRQRKSCLKRPSFQVPTPQNSKSKPLRKSRFQSIDSNKIDGRVISHTNKRKSIDKSSEEFNSQGQMDEIKHSESDSEGSQHNIFGSKRIVMSQDLRQKLGFTDENYDMTSSQNFPPNPKLKGKKSILKKNSSVLITSPNPKKTFGDNEELAKSNMSLKSKKSVMFNCTL